jgi:type VI secretion system protein ImpC
MDWLRFEDDALALYVDALSVVEEPSFWALALERRARHSLLSGIMLFPEVREYQTGPLYLPALCAVFDPPDRRARDVYVKTRITLPLDPARREPLEDALHAAAMREDERGWWRLREELDDVLHRVASRLEGHVSRLRAVEHEVDVRFVTRERARTPEPVTVTPAPSGARPALRSILTRAVPLADALATELGTTAAAVELVLREILSDDPTTVEPRLDRAIESVLSHVESTIAHTLRAILRHPALRALEATWRATRYLVEQVDVRENVRISLLSLTAAEWAADLSPSRPVEETALYDHLVRAPALGVPHRPEPLALAVSLHFHGPDPEEIEHLERMGTIAGRGQLLYIANASHRMFGYVPEGPGALTHAFGGSRPDHNGRRAVPEPTVFDGPRYERWRRFRDTEAARYVVLAVPRFALRPPWQTGLDGIGIREGARLFGPSSVLLAANVARAFARERMGSNCAGRYSHGSRVEGLPVPTERALDGGETSSAGESAMTSMLEYQLFEQGFAPFSATRGRDGFDSANTCARPKLFGNTREGKQRETDFRLGTQLPHQLYATRFAHYLRAVCLAGAPGRDKRDPEGLEARLKRWLDERVWVTAPEDRREAASRPLRSAELAITPRTDRPGAHWLTLTIEPRWDYMGATYRITVHGALEP